MRLDQVFPAPYEFPPYVAQDLLRLGLRSHEIFPYIMGDLLKGKTSCVSGRLVCSQQSPTWKWPPLPIYLA